MQKKIKAGINVGEDDPFDYFISSTEIRWCYYKETNRILGSTYGMLVLQDFEAITPNLLARTIETVEGGGVVVLLLSSLTSLQQLHTMAMDVHDRYRTEAHQDVVCRFNERFILSLASCDACLAVDDKLNVIPLNNYKIEPLPGVVAAPVDPELKSLIDSTAGTEPAHSLVSRCKTLDQAQVLLKFIEILSEKTLKYTVSLTASRGRGKSAALGLAIVSAIGFHFSNVIVTSPSPENLKTLFDFVLMGLEAIHYQQHMDYEVIYSSSNEGNKHVTRINIFRDHRQTIQYVHPDDVRKNRIASSSSELVVIDEAAAIPLPIVKRFLGPHLVFMASTINGYEGTGRSLSLKLLKQLRNQSNASNSSTAKDATFKILHEVTLSESIRYRTGDPIEAWLNSLLCLDVELEEKNVASGCPDPNDCEMHYIDRDTLFSFHDVPEAFLKRLMALYVASHYKNSPNDLQMMSDAPAHHLFALLAPMKESSKAKGKLPNVLCFVQICLEGQISKESVDENFGRGRRAAGDLIPWTISQQFQSQSFASLAGARVVRIATNPNYQGMGYGTTALKQLESYFQGQILLDPDVGSGDHKLKASSYASDAKEDDEEEGDEAVIARRKTLPPLLLKLSERKAETLDYMGVSFGLTPELFKFWKKNNYSPVYIRQTPNDVTGEHSCIALKVLTQGVTDEDTTSRWLADFCRDYERRFTSLLSFQFRSLPASLALSIITCSRLKTRETFREMTKEGLGEHITLYDLKRLEMYSQNMVDYHLIMDLIPSIAKLYFTGKLGPSINLSVVQAAVFLSLGLQHKLVEEIEEELNLPSSQILGLFNRTVRRICKYLKELVERETEKRISLPAPKQDSLQLTALEQDMDDELEEAAVEIQDQQRKVRKVLEKEMHKYSISGTEDHWNESLTSKPKSLWKLKGIKRKDGESAFAHTKDRKNQNKKKKLHT